METNYTDTAASPHIAIMFLRTFAITVCTCLVIGGNIISIIVLRRLKTLPDVTKIFLLSLALVDLFTGMFNTIFSIIPSITLSWPYGDAMCKAISLSSSMFYGISLFSLLAISVDRYIAISKPLHYPLVATRQRAICVVISTWFVTFVIAVASLFYKEGQFAYNPNFCNCIIQWGDPDFKSWNLTVMFAFILIPSTGMLLLYTRLFFVSRAHVRRISDTLKSHPGTGISRNDLKALKTMFIITGAFNIAWLPFLIAHSYMTITGKHINNTLEFFIIYLLILNSWWNVVIYTVTNRTYRQAVGGIFKSLFPCYFKNRAQAT
ncbi:octopamine receptor beta-1R-like [Antedon mediterranea]|uniref:octopamine receptor beta-1R-like n=1 Tax=Antedon mediterranea TaxID=105859 RepID=UPI003AF766B4